MLITPGNTRWGWPHRHAQAEGPLQFADIKGGNAAKVPDIAGGQRRARHQRCGCDKAIQGFDAVAGAGVSGQLGDARVDVRYLPVTLEPNLVDPRFRAVLLGTLALTGLILAAIGLYGVMSYAVTRRTREIGIRMALGAERSRVLWLVLKEVAVMAAVGIIGGLAAAFWLTRQVQAQLFGLAPSDPATLAAAASLLALIALAAGYVPARRATTIDPLVSLRTE